MNLSGKSCLVTGGARRVGRAIALELAGAGCEVVVHCHKSRTDADAVAQRIRAMGRKAEVIEGDLSDPQEWPTLIDRTVAALGRLDVLVNNASLFLTEAGDDLAAFDVERWDAMFRVNLTAPVGLCHHAAPHLAAHGDGCVVNLCDISVERPWPGHLSYAASKAGLTAMTRALARALAPKVRVNGVAPGIAIFPRSYSQELRDTLVDRVPLKREGTPEDVARAVRFLCESGVYVTGQIINIDGGRSVV